MREGIQAATRSEKRDRVTNSWLKWKAGETKICRYMSNVIAEEGSPNNIVIIKQHTLKMGDKWVTFSCSEDLGPELSRPCELCAAGERRTEKGYGLALVRSEAKGSTARNRVYEDRLEDYEYEENGQTKSGVRPQIAIVCQSVGNFWDVLAGIQDRHGRLFDYDIEMTRNGADKNTSYIPYVNPASDLDPAPYEQYKPDLKAFLAFRGSEQWYNQHLHNEVDAYIAGGAAALGEPAQPSSDWDRIQGRFAGTKA